MNDEVTCEHCGGTGHRPLTGVYAETLAGVRRRCSRSRDSYVYAGRDWKWFKAPSAMALNNRLSRLEEMGFVFSERYGRQRRFYLCSHQGDMK